MEQSLLSVKEENKKGKRLYGLDLLKILAMLYVVILHTLVHGGVVDAIDPGSFKYKAALFLEILAYPAVDIFAVISGYLAIHTARSMDRIYRRMISVWLEVVYYDVLIVVILHLIDKGSSSASDLLYGLFPVTNNAYWFFTAYFATTLISPVLIQGILNLSEKNLKVLFWIIIGVFSFLDTFDDVFAIRKGFTFVWIMLLFIEGAIIRQTGLIDNINKILAAALGMGSYIITAAGKLWDLGFEIGEKTISSGMLLSYTSPTIVFVAIVYLALFKPIQISHKIEKTVRSVAEGIFAVYLLNDNVLILNNYLLGRFAGFAEYGVLSMLLAVIGFSAAFLIVSIIADKPRQLLFKAVSSMFSKHISTR